MSGQLWVIEGADGSGKATQAKLLVERLNQSGKLGPNAAHFWSFPSYEDQVWGKLIKEYLSGPHNKAGDVDPKYASLLYAGDRGKAAEKIRPLLASGDWVICDRYASSNMAHQGAKIPDLGKRDEFVQWLEDLEYKYFGIPMPTGTFYLSLPVEISVRRTENRLAEAEARGEVSGDKIKKRDIHEQDAEYMAEVRREYVRLAEKFHWHVIECIGNDRELSRQEISNIIWQKINEQN